MLNDCSEGLYSSLKKLVIHSSNVDLLEPILPYITNTL